MIPRSYPASLLPIGRPSQEPLTPPDSATFEPGGKDLDERRSGPGGVEKVAPGPRFPADRVAPGRGRRMGRYGNDMADSSKVIGIDLGTTNSVVAVMEGG